MLIKLNEKLGTYKFDTDSITKEKVSIEAYYDKNTEMSMSVRRTNETISVNSTMC